jgi:prepilin-type N-terminal cleavage/methylation domain-containing protein
MKRTTKRTEGFSLLELVVVVVIIGIIAAVAIPRLSRGSAGAADAALSSDLAVLRNAIDLYAAEHNGAFPTKDKIADALLKYTDTAGVVNPTKDTTYIYGPYIYRIPPLPVGIRKGKTGISDVDDPNVGWIYDEKVGTIGANCASSEKDGTDKPYKDY